MARISIRRRFKRYPGKDECVPILNLNAFVRQHEGRTCIDLDDKQLEKIVTKTIIFLAQERMARKTGEDLVDEAVLGVMSLFDDFGPSGDA